MDHILCIHSKLKHGHLGSFQVLAVTYKASMTIHIRVHICFCVDMFSDCLGIYQGV